MHKLTGDFYYATEYKDALLVCVGDCTGHGIPAALLSFMYLSTLQQILQLRQLMFQWSGKWLTPDEPSDILHQLRTRVKRMFLVRPKGKYEILKETRSPVGVYPKELPFQTIKCENVKGSMLYLFSDGYYTQLGQPETKEKDRPPKKLGKTKFFEMLQRIEQYELNTQKAVLQNIHKLWRKDFPQTDDIAVIGIRF